MKEKVDNFLKSVNSKNDRELFIALIYLAMIFFETENNEGIKYLAKDYYNKMISEGRGFSNSDNKFSPSVVEFGELTGFMFEDISKIKSGEISKNEALKSYFNYIKENILNL
ncbi:MAG: hypothetical protein Q4A27_02700 [bacterium]|nr:hypothetical protein [bacterium]